MVGLLLVDRGRGKSALVPFSGWLPRAMEGPTPSSAVFYGALSVHLGAFLLLRVSPLLDISTTLCVVIVILGLATAVLAYLACRVQTDIKAALSFASLAQVGIIVAEIGVGFRYVALVHLLGHACMRTLQFITGAISCRITGRLKMQSGGVYLVPRTFGIVGQESAPGLAVSIGTRAGLSRQGTSGIHHRAICLGLSAM